MASFINLHDNIDWTDKDITNRTEAMVAAIVSPDDERILNRKLQAVQLGEYVLDQDDMIQIGLLKEVANRAHMAGIMARADIALLRSAWAVEKAQNVLFRSDDYALAQSKINELLNKTSLSVEEEAYLLRLQNTVSPSDVEITEAHTVINSASPEVLSLVQSRLEAGVSYVPNISVIVPDVTDPDNNSPIYEITMPVPIVYIHRCDVLPETLEPNTMYCVKRDDDLFDVHFTDETGNNVYHLITKEEISQVVGGNAVTYAEPEW